MGAIKVKKAAREESGAARPNRYTTNKAKGLRQAYGKADSTIDEEKIKESETPEEINKDWPRGNLRIY